MALVNAKLVRFLKKDANHQYITDQETIAEPAQEVLRDSVMVTQAEIDASAASVQTTGLMYVEIVE